MIIRSDPGRWKVLALAAAFFLALAEPSEGEDVGREDNEAVGERDDYIPVPVDKMVEVLGWADDDPVTVFYSEYLMASWLLQRAPWNVYHSGLAFVNNRTGNKSMYDFAPQDTSSVMGVVLPYPNISSLWRAVVLGEVDFVYNDNGHVHTHLGWGRQFEKYEKLSVINGSVFNAYAHRIAVDLAPRFTTFRPVEVATQAPTLNAEHGVALRSLMCHDFVADSLWVLYELGARYTFKPKIYRDHVIMYADEYKRVKHDDKRMVRKQLRYLRSLEPYMAAIKSEFTNSRVSLIALWKLGMSTFFRSPDGDHLLHLVPPFINYCYIPLALPPVHYNPFAREKLCALGMQSNLTNTSALWPVGHLLAVEERMDELEVFTSFFMIVLSSLVMGAFPSAVQARAKLD